MIQNLHSQNRTLVLLGTDPTLYSSATQLCSISSVDQRVMAEGGVPKGSPISLQTCRFPTAGRDWYTDATGQVVAHRRPVSINAATAAHPSVCSTPASRAAPSDPCLRSVAQHCSRANAMPCVVAVPEQDCARCTPAPANNAHRPEGTKRSDPATGARFVRGID